MHTPHYTILYVADPQASARLYAGLLGAEAIDAMPTFALFALEGGRMLGLWARDAVKPPADFHGSGSEIALRVDGVAAVDALHADWRARGLDILQAPAVLDFGYTFTAADPDGHRLRVFARTE
ncbi:VOC family protein [uncultured Massilia sp.]|uniref:VOC family protein n=1 Tax=uncultured Massilia sp. TaxID=169973 RepID=UPI0025ED4CBC|nr:VOC family protein [uncultured Massilia sp.]